MDYVTAFKLGMFAFQTIAAAAHKDGLVELAGHMDAAMVELNKVHGSDVTKAQLESLRAK